MGIIKRRILEGQSATKPPLRHEPLEEDARQGSYRYAHGFLHVGHRLIARARE